MNKSEQVSAVQHVFIVGSKSLGQYGGYETFVDNLVLQHENEPEIKYHIACKANGEGSMDESQLSGVTGSRMNGGIAEFDYHNAHVFKIPVPPVGPAAAILYDLAALKYCVRYCKEHAIRQPIIYILACRIGPFLRRYRKQINRLGGKLLINPDGHEWKRAKWNALVKKYWKLSEKLMVKQADHVVCDSVNIEQYIRQEYKDYLPETTYIAYGAWIEKSPLQDNDPGFAAWLREKNLHSGEYYLIVGRFVPENNYETMIREFMRSESKRDLAIITNENGRFFDRLETKLQFKSDPRIRFVGTVYDRDLLKKIRENAYGYLHGHEVGGTNPSLLEAMGSTKLNLLLDVGFNREVGGDAALYWQKEEGKLADLIRFADTMSEQEADNLGKKARERIQTYYSWTFIGEEYRKLWDSMKEPIDV